jgi:hypothetical protein
MLQKFEICEVWNDEVKLIICEVEIVHSPLKCILLNVPDFLSLFRAGRWKSMGDPSSLGVVESMLQSIIAYMKV